MGKWKLYVPIFLIFVCLLGCLAFGLGTLAQRNLTPADLQFRDARHNLPLVPYYDEAADSYFLFLPSCTSPSDLTVTNPITGEDMAYFLIDIYQGEEDSSPSAAISTMELTISRETHRLSLWRCDGLPTLFLQGKPNMMDKVHADKENKVSAQVTILDETGGVLLQDLATLSGRGNGTWSNAGILQAKLPYNLRFSSQVSFGPFEGIRDLCLFAEYSDESKLRNSLTYFAAQSLGLDYASGYTYVNVFQGGEYLGLYGLATKKEYTKHIEADGISAVFESTSIQKVPSFVSQHYGQPMKVMYGSSDLTQDVVNRFEEALSREDWDACASLIDLDSFARMYLLEEFFCNIDLSYASQYFYIDSEGILHTMLPWDFDFTMGSAITHFEPHQERTIMAYRNLLGYSWYPVLIRWEAFRQQVVDILTQSFTDEFLDSLSAHLLQDMRDIESSRACDLRRWEAAPSFTATPLSSGMTSLSEFYSFFTDFFPKRRAFLLEYFRDMDRFCCITIRPEDGIWYNNVCIPKGSRPSDFLDEAEFLRRYAPDSPGGKILATESGTPLSELAAVSEDLTLIVLPS